METNETKKEIIEPLPKRKVWKLLLGLILLAPHFYVFYTYIKLNLEYSNGTYPASIALDLMIIYTLLVVIGASIIIGCVLIFDFIKRR